MPPLRRLALALTVVWVLVATNPDASSFRAYLAARSSPPPWPLTVPPAAQLLKSVFSAPPPAPRALHKYSLTGLDCALFTVAHLRYGGPLRYDAVSSSATRTHAYIGITGVWLPVPAPSRSLTPDALRGALRAALSSARAAGPPRALPDRPWEWLVGVFAAAGAFWTVMPTRAAAHMTLTWDNVRHAGRWWTLVLFHLSHGGSTLRLSRTVFAFNRLAPLLLQRGALTLSGLYGVVLTAAAMSTALTLLVLARRHVFGARYAPHRTALQINGGGGCVYALLVVSCLDAQSGRADSVYEWPVRPFGLLMVNIAFDAMFLAGQERVADYVAHTGAALGAWVYVSCNS